MLRISTLGGLAITRDDQRVMQLATRKVEMLLVYLACTGRSHPREVLAELFWEERPQDRALGNLRVALSSLRKHLDEYTVITRQTAALNPDADIWVDALALEELAVRQPEKAIELYQGEFLAGVYLRSAPQLEAWIALERERLHRIVVSALHRQIEADIAARRWERGLAYAERLLGLDSLDEAAHRHRMRLLVYSDQRASALAQYEACCQILDQELGVAPGEETVRLHEQIRDGLLELPALSYSVQPAPSFPTFLDDQATGEKYQPPVFVAREKELGKLNGFLAAMRAGQGQMVFVTGGPGRGKTALLAEFARQAMNADPNLLVASGNCSSYSGVGDAYLPFREVLSMLTGDVEGRWRARTISREHARRVWAALPKMAQSLLDHGPHVVPALLRGGPLLSRVRAATPDRAAWVQQLAEQIERRRTPSESLEQSQLFQQVANVLCELAEAHPLLLILDDLQWTDTASVGLLFHLGHRLAGSRILIAGAYRPEELVLDGQGERHPLEKVLAEFKRRYGDVCVDLADVGEPDGRQFVDALLATEAHRLGVEFQGALYRQTGGHPLFTIELLRAMQQRGDLHQDEAGHWVVGPKLDWETLPTRVEAVIEERVGRLDLDLQRILIVSSVEGEVFTAQVTARLVEIDELALLQRLSHVLERRHRLVRSQEELQVGSLHLSRYRFAHALFQRYLYRSLSAGERRLLHGQVAAALEELYRGQEELVAVELARHHSEAGDDPRALKYLTLAAGGALAAYAHREAEIYYRWALELAGTDAERAHLLVGLGKALSGQAAFDAAVEVWREAIALYETLGDLDRVAYLYASAAAAAWDNGDLPRGLRLCERGMAAVRGAPESPGLAFLLRELGRAYFFAGGQEQDRAWPLCTQALEMAERLGAVEVQAYTLVSLGILGGQTYQDQLRALERAVELAREAGLVRTERHAHNNLCHVWGNVVGDLGQAMAHIEQAAALARNEGCITDEIFNLANAVDVALAQGDLQKAEASYTRMRTLQSDFGDFGRSAYFVPRCEARLQAFRGEWEEALHSLHLCQEDARGRRDAQDLVGVGWLEARLLVDVYLLTGAVPAGGWVEAERCLTLGRLTGPRYHCYRSVIQAYQGKLEIAETVLAKARSAADAQHNPQDEAWLLWAKATLAAKQKRWPEALATYEALADHHARTGRRWEQARVLVERAEVHTGRGERGDAERARDLLHESQSMFAAMGAQHYVTVIGERLQALAAKV